MTAAGLIVLATSTGRLLLLLRSKGLWSFPGGYIEPGEDALRAALRETAEETGYGGPLRVDSLRPAAVLFHARERSPDVVSPPPMRGAAVAYVAFLAFVPREFRPALDREHVGARWVSPEELATMPLHPGVIPALNAARGSGPSR